MEEHQRGCRCSCGRGAVGGPSSGSLQLQLGPPLRQRAMRCCLEQRRPRLQLGVSWADGFCPGGRGAGHTALLSRGAGPQVAARNHHFRVRHPSFAAAFTRASFILSNSRQLSLLFLASYSNQC